MIEALLFIVMAVGLVFYFRFKSKQIKRKLSEEVLEQDSGGLNEE